jgi:hypothetical protein
MESHFPPKNPDPLRLELPEPEPAPKPFQFSLRHLLAVMAAVCVAGAGYQWIGPGVLCVLALVAVAYGFFLAMERSPGATVILTVVLVGGFLMLSLPAVAPLGPRSPAKRTVCHNNLRQITLALQNYHDVYKSFPPAYVADENGKPMHSWRVLLLPFIRPDIYQAYRFDEPWDGPNNRQFADSIVSLYQCPSDGEDMAGQTSYVAVVGPGTAWPGAKSVRLGDIADGPENTILIVEVHKSGIHWMEPRDLDASQMPMTINARPAAKGASPGISSGHPGVAQAARADGSVFAIDEDTPPATVRAMLTIAGGETVVKP